MAALRLRERRTRRWWYAGATLAAAAFFVVFFVASSGASSQTLCAANTLTGSNFEIDPVTGGNGTNKSPYTGGANLVRGGSSPCIDWQNTLGGAADLFAAGIAKRDKGVGSSDDSFAQGTSENDTNPVISTGSIPPNKSDLQAFGAYKEVTSGGKFLDLFWSRTSGPTGTTVMDFELNQKSCAQVATDSNCYVNPKSDKDANGNPLVEMPVRTDGDLLISYIFSGSATPTVCMYKWDGPNSLWKQPGVQISGSAQIANVCGTGSTFRQNDALGAINFDLLGQANTYGLGDLSALSFGELSVNFNAIFSGITDCKKFGSAHLSSRSSATFTDELKDFIGPEPINITNCATLSTSASNSSSAQTIGGSISDTATLSNASSPSGTITFKAYGPEPGNDPTADTCVDGAGGNLVFTSSAQSLTGPDGSGNYTATASFTPTSVGRYEWVASFSGDSNNSSKSGSCKDSNELSLVGPKTPTLTTSATSPVTVGSSINDNASLSGTASKPNGNPAGGTITFTAYLNDSTCKVTPAFTSSAIPVSGDNTYNSGNFTPTTAGTYYWIASYTGDTPNTNPKTGTCGDSGETSVVNPKSPAISTSATAGPVSVGTALNDTAHLTGTANKPSGDPAGGTITFNLYGPESGTGSCPGGDLVATVTISVGGDGYYSASAGNVTFGSLTPSQPGTYNWVASYGGDSPNTNSVSGTCGDTGEASVVTKLPSTIDTAQSWYPNDTATIGGGGGGTVTFTLYKNSACVSGAVLGPLVVNVVNGSASTSNTTFAIGSVGASGDTYYWKAAYSGDGTHKAVTSCVETTVFSSLTNGTQQSSG